MQYFYGIPYRYQMYRQQQFPPAPDCPGGTVYTVRPGDTMFRISNSFGISLQSLIIANPQVTNPNILFPGQQLCIPAEVTPPPPQPFCTNGIIYTIQRGDSLFTIARRYNLTVQQMIQANPQISDPNVVEVGQRICIPIPVPPLPEGVKRVELLPAEAGMLGGTAFINFKELVLWMAAFGLPDPGEIGPEYTAYWGWLVHRDQASYVPIPLASCGESGVMAGTKKGTGSWEGYHQVIVTAEAQANPQRPNGPVLMRGTVAE